MPIKVRVLNIDPDNCELPKIREDEIGKILTPEYIEEVNRGIARRLMERQIGQVEQEELQRRLRKTVFK